MQAKLWFWIFLFAMLVASLTIGYHLIGAESLLSFLNTLGGFAFTLGYVIWAIVTGFLVIPAVFLSAIYFGYWMEVALPDSDGWKWLKVLFAILPAFVFGFLVKYYIAVIMPFLAPAIAPLALLLAAGNGIWALFSIIFWGINVLIVAAPESIE